MITGRHQILFQPSPVLVFPLVRRLHAGRPRPEARVAAEGRAGGPGRDHHGARAEAAQVAAAAVVIVAVHT